MPIPVLNPFNRNLATMNHPKARKFPIIPPEANRVTNLPSIYPPIDSSTLIPKEVTADGAVQLNFTQKIGPTVITDLHDAGFEISDKIKFTLISSEEGKHRNKNGILWSGIATEGTNAYQFRILTHSNDAPLVLQFQKQIDASIPTNHVLNAIGNYELTRPMVFRSEGQYLLSIGTSGINTPVKIRNSALCPENQNFFSVHNFPLYHDWADTNFEYVHMTFDIRDPLNPIPVSWNLYKGRESTDKK